MKTLLTLALGTCLLAGTAGAQNAISHAARNNAVRFHEHGISYSAAAPAAMRTHSFAKATTATPFFTEPFSATSLTTGGWTTSGSFAGWRFTKQRASGSYSIPAIQSTTAAGGWMLFDSDSIGANGNNLPVTGSLTSPVIPCTGHSYVGVRFQQYTRRFNDTFYVQVSNDGGTNWTSYPITVNNSLDNNDEIDNPTVTTINVTPTAANQANVKVRFYYSCSDPLGGYNWLVDDFQMLDLDAVDLGLTRPGVVMTLGSSGLTPVGTMYKYFVDTLLPVTGLNNLGGLAQTNAAMSSQIYYNGTATSFNQNITVASLPINLDTDFFTGSYIPTASGPYMATFSVNQSGDAVAGNNLDTARFNISDSSLCVFRGYQESSKSLAANSYAGYAAISGPASGSNPAYTYYEGSFFEIPAGTRKDTITSVSVALASGTTAGAQIVAEIYKLDQSGSNAAWIYKGATYPKTLAASDISTTGSYTFTSLQMNVIQGSTRRYVIADAGFWAVVVRPQQSTTPTTIRVLMAQPAVAVSILGHYGVEDTSSGSVGSFGANLGGSNTYRTSGDVPAVIVNFGSARGLGVQTVAGLNIGHAYPNPANTSISIPVAATTAAKVNVSLYNMTGQLVQSQDLGTVAAGAKATAVFSTASLPAGTYLCTIAANGERSTERIVVTH